MHDEVLVWLQIRPEHGSKKNRDTGYRPAEFGRNGLAEELCFKECHRVGRCNILQGEIESKEIHLREVLENRSNANSGTGCVLATNSVALPKTRTDHCIQIL